MRLSKREREEEKGRPREGARKEYSGPQILRYRYTETSPGSESSGHPQSLFVSGILEGFTFCLGRGTKMAHVPNLRPMERN